MHLSRIHLYPIKSLDGHAVAHARLTEGGILEHDRVYQLVNAEGKRVNGKREPRLHLIRAVYSEDVSRIHLSAAGRACDGSFAFSDSSGIGGWLSAFLGYPVELHHEPRRGFPDDVEAYGPTVVSEGSLNAVAGWFPGLTIDNVRRRFRANLEIATDIPFWEDRLFAGPGELRPFSIGDVSLLGHNPCQRCAVPTRDPSSGEGLPGFQQHFMDQRRATLPPWADTRRFNHPYRLTVNTSVPASETGKTLSIGDPVTPADAAGASHFGPGR